ncbi:MAG: hypothetical protein MK132_14525 [Lentisphaerales bacterium]|nr:hypothetical protein [Lentisphaerales bacterium]
MKIVDGNCPYCETQISVKPGKVKKEIVCSGCGRVLTLLPAAYQQQDGDFKTLEPGLLGSFFLSLVIAAGMPFVTIMLAIALTLIMGLLYTNEQRLPSFGPKVDQRVAGSIERLRVFPFEMYLIAFWGLAAVFHLVGASFLLMVNLSVMMMLASLIAIQANRIYLDKKIKTSEVHLLDMKMFYNLLLDPQTAFEKGRQRGSGVAVESNEENSNSELFSKAAAKRQEIEQKKEDELQSDDLKEKRKICSNERKRWEEDMLTRYNSWLQDESTRLIAEKG